MALTVIVEDGTGKADANSYASVSEADAYFASRPRSTAWPALSAEQKSRLLVHATRILETSVKWDGAKYTEEQSLAFPRYPDDLEAVELPLPIKLATYELAYALNQRDLTGESSLGAFSELEIGPLKFKAAGSEQRLETIPPFVRDIIAPYGCPRGTSLNASLIRR